MRRSLVKQWKRARRGLSAFFLSIGSKLEGDESAGSDLPTEPADAVATGAVVVPDPEPEERQESAAKRQAASAAGTQDEIHQPKVATVRSGEESGIVTLTRENIPYVTVIVAATALIVGGITALGAIVVAYRATKEPIPIEVIQEVVREAVSLAGENQRDERSVQFGVERWRVEMVTRRPNECLDEKAQKFVPCAPSLPLGKTPSKAQPEANTVADGGKD